MLTLTQKEKQMLATVGFPTQENWQLLCSNDADTATLIEKANDVLLKVLELCKEADPKYTWGSIGDAVYKSLEHLDRQWPDCGLLNNEGRRTIAQFFALNYQLPIYHFLRYYGSIEH